MTGLVLTPALDELALLDAYADRMDLCAITVKGPMNEGTRYEAEREIDVSVGLEMVRRGGSRVAKTRHSVVARRGRLGGRHLRGRATRPLVVAEVERGGPVTDLTIPSFCVTEVTSDPRFSNDALAGRPYGAVGGARSRPSSRPTVRGSCRASGTTTGPTGNKGCSVNH